MEMLQQILAKEICEKVGNLILKWKMENGKYKDLSEIKPENAPDSMVNGLLIAYITLKIFIR